MASSSTPATLAPAVGATTAADDGAASPITALEGDYNDGNGAGTPGPGAAREESQSEQIKSLDDHMDIGNRIKDMCIYCVFLAVFTVLFALFV